VADDLERRLRDSLRAYAELVQAPERQALRERAATPQPVLRRWRGAVLAAAAAAAVVSGSVWAVSGHDPEPVAGPAASRVATPTESETWAAAEATSGSPGDVLTAPPSPEPGIAYPLDLYTHCGVLGTDVGGVWFAADPPLVEGAGNPPAGWGNPYQRGTLTLMSAGEAVFTDDAGHEVRLRADDSARPTPCD
jgi:hypothetical protein